jgi:hypothetical protein
VGTGWRVKPRAGRWRWEWRREGRGRQGHGVQLSKGEEAKLEVEARDGGEEDEEGGGKGFDEFNLAAESS